MKYLGYLFILPVLRFLFAGALLLKSSPGGFAPVLRFTLAALVLLFGPGLALRRLLRKHLPNGFAINLLFVLTTSLATCGLCVWELYFFNCYTRTVLLVALVLFTVAGLYGLFENDLGTCILKTYDNWRRLSVSDQVLLVLFACFIEALFESSVGLPYTDWDAVVSWDKWALDMSMRKGLGGYLMGGYPQFFSSINSVFYKLAETGNVPLPPEQLLLHGFQVIYPVLIGLSLWCIGQRFHFKGLLAFFLFVSIPSVFQCLSNGYADIPLTAFLASGFVMTDALARSDPPEPQSFLWNWTGFPLFVALLFFPCVFTKATGILWIVFFTVRLCVISKRPMRFGWMIGLLFSLGLFYPFIAIQRWLTANPTWRETAPFLHSFPVIFAHVSIFTPNLSHLADCFRRVFTDKLAIITYPLWLTVVLTAITVLLSLCHKKSRCFLLLAVASLTFWFYTASYDLRNAFPALCTAVCAVVAIPVRPVRRKGPWKDKLRPLAFLILLLAIALPAFANRILPTLRTEVKRYHAPRAFSDGFDTRHMVFRPEGDLRNILYEAPYGLRAVHLITGNHLYRLLAPKGVYAVQQNAYNDSRPHDIVVQNKGLKAPPSSFVPVSEIRRAPGYRTLWMNRPAFKPCNFHLTEPGLATTRATTNRLQAASMQKAEFPPGTLFEIELLPSMQNKDGKAKLPGKEKTFSKDIRDGVIELRVSSVEDIEEIGLADNDAKRDPFSAYIAPYRDIASKRIRILYWMKDDGPAIPHVRIRTGNKPLVIEGVSLSRARY